MFSYGLPHPEVLEMMLPIYAIISSIYRWKIQLIRGSKQKPHRPQQAHSNQPAGQAILEMTFTPIKTINSLSDRPFCSTNIILREKKIPSNSVYGNGDI
jgi:hypothetical protein